MLRFRFLCWLPSLALLAYPSFATACSQCPEKLALKRTHWQCLFEALPTYQQLKSDPVPVMVHSNCAQQRKELESKITSPHYNYYLLGISGGSVPSGDSNLAKAAPKTIVVWQDLDKKSSEALFDAYMTGTPSGAAMQPKVPTVLPWSTLEITTQNALLERWRKVAGPTTAPDKMPRGNPNLVVLNFDSDTSFGLVPVVSVDPKLTPPKTNTPAVKAPDATGQPHTTWSVVWLTKAHLACIASLRPTIEVAKEDPYTLVMAHCK